MTPRTLPLLVLLVAPIAAAGAFPSLACTSGANRATHRTAGAGGNTGSASSSGSSGGGMPGLGGASSAGGTAGASAAPATGGSLGSGGAAGLEGDGGGGGSAVGTGGAPVRMSSSSSSVAAQSSGGSPACAIGHVVIGEIRSRGAGGAADEFVALFNATGSAVTLDASWVLEVRGTSDADYRAHWTGAGKSVPAWGHFLIAGTAYAEMPAADQALSSGIVDAASLRLVHTGATVDAVCYAFSAATQAAFDATFTCAGTPASNLPHDNTASAASNADASIARRPGGAAGNCTDTGDDADDFVAQSPATPESSASPPTP